MKNATRLTALVTAAMLLLATAQTAQADDRNGSRRSGMSTTEKVLTAAAVTAVAGLLVYKATRDDDRYQHRRDYRGQYDYRRPPRQHQRSYVAFNVGFQSYCVGEPGRRYSRAPRGYWYGSGAHRFYRVPFRYNSRYSRAFNAGWERGYWAGYLQGVQDSRMRAQYYDRFQWQDRGPMWGYNNSYGAAGQYQEAFHAAFSIGYRHAFRGHGYGHDGFGFGIQFSYRR